MDLDAMDLSQMENAPEQIFTITLSNGTQITNLRLSGNTFTSPTKLTKSIFDGGLDKVLFTDGMMSNEHGAMTLVSLEDMGEGTQFVLRDLTKEEILEMNVRGDIAFLAMMTDVDMMA